MKDGSQGLLRGKHESIPEQDRARTEGRESEREREVRGVKAWFPPTGRGHSEPDKNGRYILCNGSKVKCFVLCECVLYCK